MTIHLCRDFLTDTNASSPGTNMYALAMFLFHVGGFRIVGHTSFDLLQTASVGFGISGAINTGFGTYEVTLPTASYTVSSADVGRILALRSGQHPLANSGLFRVESVDVPNNGLVIDYRSSAAPPVENDIPWYLFINETMFAATWQSGSNGYARYASYTVSGSVADCSRIMMLSPDESSWMVRMCLESLHDVDGACPSTFTIAPGFGGNSNGDFAPLVNAGVNTNKVIHLHAAAFYDTTSSHRQGLTVGLSPAAQISGSLWTTGQWRISMIVDTVSGTCGIVNEAVAPAYVKSGWCVFGLTQDETEIPSDASLNDPSVNINRLFVVGSSNPQANLTWQTQFHSDNVTQVVGWSKLGYPYAGVLSLYSDISNPGYTHSRYLTSSVDNVWNGQTELLDAEVLLGTVDQAYAASYTTTLWPLLPRRVGRLPFFMQGRANFADWTVTGDGGWYHTNDGIFMQWGGPEPVSNVVTSSAYTINGSNELQQGLDPLGGFLPGSDPPVPPVVPNTQDIDATRFKKTYSYFRQVPVIAGVIKGGSNPAKP